MENELVYRNFPTKREGVTKWGFDFGQDSEQQIRAKMAQDRLTVLAGKMRAK